MTAMDFLLESNGLHLMCTPVLLDLAYDLGSKKKKKYDLGSI